VIVMAGTVAEEGADRASFVDSTGLSLTAFGDGLDWYVARPNALSTATSNAAANSNTVAMITGILGAASTTSKPMAAKTALVLKDNAGVAMDPKLLGAAGPAMLEVWFPGQEDGHIVRRSAVRCAQSVRQIAGDVPENRPGVSGLGEDGLVGLSRREERSRPARSAIQGRAEHRLSLV
jgi:hypothetical protein